jgi:hypothetical protein
MKIRIILALGFLGFDLVARSMNGIVYDKESHQTKVLYRWQRVEQGDAKHLSVKLQFKNIDGTLAAEETATVENSKVVEYAVNQVQTNERGKLLVNEGKVNFEYTREGKTETNQENLADNLVVPPTVVDYVLARFDKIKAGETIPVRLGVLDRKETVGFEFFKDKDKSTPDTVVVKMKPSSIFIAAVVDPLYFTFDSEGKGLIEIVGRTLPKQKVDGQWRDLDANIVYHYTN